MKILAVRGCNLASLAGEFEIDLAHGALGGAGVFAIVGPTGAGKSTLLDAICVALFDRTPRLTNRSTVTVGRGDDDPSALGAQDVRTILRRGATAGWAEVDFESGDARQYRARWSVRRARDRSDGNLQAQQMTLTAIDGGERFGGTRTETLDAIHERLGLTFDQFRRSALLAQGEFAAFLRADGRDRSELLERMTGTEIYTRLSIAAHVRATEAELRLRDGRTALLAIAPLEDDARRVVEVELAAAHELRRTTRERHAAAELAERWLADAAVRERGHAEAVVAHGAAVTAAAAAAPARVELALRRRAEQLRGPWDAAAGLERRLGASRAEATAAEAAERTARGEHALIVERRGAVAALHEPVRAARIAVGLVERRTPALASPGAALLQRGVERLVIDAAADAAWLVTRTALGAEVAAWSELDLKFAQRAAIADQIAAIAGTLRAHAESRARLERSREVIVVDQRAAVAKLAEVKDRAASFQRARTGGMTFENARRLEDEARARLAEVERLIAIAAGAREAIAARRELDHQLAELATVAATDRTRRADLEATRATTLAVRDERTRMLDELRRAAGFDHARTKLVEGDPCPLCGALEHPWRDRGAIDGVIQEAESRLVELGVQLDALGTTLVTLDARALQRDRERVRLVTHRATTVTTAEAAIPTWRQQLAALGELVLIDDPTSLEAERLVGERELAARKQLEDARATRGQVAAMAKAIADAQGEIQVWLANVEQLATRLADLDRKVAELDSTVERVRGERAGRLERHAELASELDAAIGRWRASLPPEDRALDGPSPARLTDGDPELGPRLDRARVAMVELATAWRTRADRVAEGDAALAAAVDQLELEARAAERAVAEHATRRAEAARRRDELVIEHAAAVARLEAGRLAAEFRLDELGALLAAAGQVPVEQLAERVAERDRVVDLSQALVIERARLVDDHATRQPAELAEATRLAEHAAAVAEADHHAARLSAVLEADTLARARREAALAALTAAEADAEIDRVLGEVIGSHDGKLFRSFAQSLTLDGLLAVANAHLEELAPRYQLERVPRHDLELQVIDRDLGGEVRSVQSLSGGESFLVSLALALGLSSMSAHDVRVRTLLIDEGFGTLDPATLDGALAVLDRLQATGRQVGVISHVPALVERVGAHVRVNPRGGGRSEVVVG